MRSQTGTDSRYGRSIDPAARAPGMSAPGTLPRRPGWRRRSLIRLAALVAILAGVLRGQESAEAVQRLVDGFLEVSPGSPAATSRILIVPAVTQGAAGRVAGQAVARCPRGIDRVVLLCEEDTPAGIALPTWSSLRTPLGPIEVDLEALASCRDAVGAGAALPGGRFDQALASILPFLQRRLQRPFQILPVAAGRAADPDRLAEALLPWVRQERTALLIVAPDGLSPAMLEDLFSLADTTPTTPAALRALRAMAITMGWKPLLAAHDSGPDGRSCVSALLVDDPNRLDLLARAAQAEWKDPETKAAFAEAYRAAADPTYRGQPLNRPEQQVLLSLARRTILAKLTGDDLPEVPLYSDRLLEPGGCFVTLNQKGARRGTVGSIAAKDSLAATVQRHAIAVATEDKHFAPLTLEELPAVTLSISVLTPPRRLEWKAPQDLLEQLQPGIHGVLLTYDDRQRATFLPQVWAEAPTKESFLNGLCRRAGAPQDAWRDPAKTRIEVYECFEFSEAAP